MKSLKMNQILKIQKMNHQTLRKNQRKVKVARSQNKARNQKKSLKKPKKAKKAKKATRWRHIARGHVCHSMKTMYRAATPQYTALERVAVFDLSSVATTPTTGG